MKIHIYMKNLFYSKLAIEMLGLTVSFHFPSEHLWAWGGGGVVNFSSRWTHSLDLLRAFVDADRVIVAFVFKKRSDSWLGACLSLECCWVIPCH